MAKMAVREAPARLTRGSAPGRGPLVAAHKAWRSSTPLYVMLLGLRTSDPLEVLKRVRVGLNYHALEAFQRNTNFSTSEVAALVSIKLRTLHRRKEEGRLGPDESDRLVRVSRLFARAIELFEGDAEAARRWFYAPARGLGDERPIALAGTDIGAREVEALIDRLEQGVLT